MFILLVLQNLFLAVRSMFDFVFRNIKELPSSDGFGQGVYLWVFHADKIPPHIGVSQNGSFYSLKSSGVDLGLETDKVLSLILRKRIPSFIIQVKDNTVTKSAHSVFEQYSQTEAGKTTCLTPVKEMFGCSQPKKLSELLRDLDTESKILNVFRLNGDNDLIGIRAYDPERITERLVALEKLFV